MLVVVGALVVGAAAVEAGLRLFSPVEMRAKGDGTINLPYFKAYRIDNHDNPKLEASLTARRNSLGFRGAEPPAAFADALTVVAVGGSTTECFFVGDGKTWPELVGTTLAGTFDRLWVNNAGLLGHSTFGHLILMRQQVEPLRPKVVLFMAGINDRARTDTTSIEDDLLVSRRGGASRWLLAHSELASLAWSIHRTLTATKLGIDNTGIDFPKLPQVDVSAQKRDTVLALHRGAGGQGYADRLRQLVARSRAAGILPVLVTQTAAFGPGIDDATGIDLGRMAVDDINGALAWEVLELYNDATRKVAAETGTDLIDLGRALPISTAYYYDMVHYSVAGSAKVAEIVARGLCPVLAKNFPEWRRGSCPG
jgi:lysophospholipase L1-like esterase